MGRMKLKTIVCKLQNCKSGKPLHSAVRALSRVSLDELGEYVNDASRYVLILWRSIQHLRGEQDYFSGNMIAGFLCSAASNDSWLMGIGSHVLPSLYAEYQSVLASFQGLSGAGSDSGKLSLTIPSALQHQPNALRLLASFLDIAIECCDLEGTFASKHLLGFVRATSAVLLGTSFESSAGFGAEEMYACDVLRRNSSYCLSNIVETMTECRIGAAALLRSRCTRLMDAIGSAPEISIQRSLIRLARAVYQASAEDPSLKRFLDDMNTHLTIVDKRAASRSSPSAMTVFTGIDLMSNTAGDQVERLRELLCESRTTDNSSLPEMSVIACHAYFKSVSKDSVDARAAVVDWNERCLSLKILDSVCHPHHVPYCKLRQLHVSSDLREVVLTPAQGSGDVVTLCLSSDHARKAFKACALPRMKNIPGLQTITNAGSLEPDHRPQRKGSRKTSVVESLVGTLDQHSSRRLVDVGSGSNVVPEDSESQRVSSSTKSSTDPRESKPVLVFGETINSVFAMVRSDNILLSSHRFRICSDPAVESVRKSGAICAESELVEPTGGLHQEGRMETPKRGVEFVRETPELGSRGASTSAPKCAHGEDRPTQRKSSHSDGSLSSPEHAAREASSLVHDDNCAKEHSMELCPGASDLQKCAIEDSTCQKRGVDQECKAMKKQPDQERIADDERLDDEARSLLCIPQDSNLELASLCDSQTHKNGSPRQEMFEVGDSCRDSVAHSLPGGQGTMPVGGCQDQVEEASSWSKYALSEGHQVTRSGASNSSGMTNVGTLSCANETSHRKAPEETTLELKRDLDVDSTGLQSGLEAFEMSQTSPPKESFASRDRAVKSDASGPMKESTDSVADGKGVEYTSTQESDVVEKLARILRATLSSRLKRSRDIQVTVEEKVKRLRQRSRAEDSRELSIARDKLCSLAAKVKTRLESRVKSLRNDVNVSDAKLGLLQPALGKFEQHVSSVGLKNKRRLEEVKVLVKKRQRVLAETGRREVSAARERRQRSSREDVLVSGISKLLGSAL